MSKKFFHCVVPSCALFFLILSASAQTPNTTANTAPRAPAKQPQPQTKQAQLEPKVPMAAWSDSAAESLIGMTKADFESLGLGKLTASEYAAFVPWVFIKEAKATKAAQASQLTYSCGRLSIDTQDYEKVNIYMVVEDSTPAELASRIRQNLRALSDVQIVFSSEEADLTVDVVGFPLETVSGQKTGYVASIVTSEPCVSKIGSDQSSFKQFQTASLQTGGMDVARVAEAITTKLDATNIETARKNNAAMIQFLKNKK